MFRVLPIFFCALALPAQAQVSFVDVAPQVGIAGISGAMGNGIGGGVSWIDADGDGWLDLLYSGAVTAPRLYRQTSNGFSEDIAALLPDTPPGHGGGHVVFDMEGDGDPDILLLRTRRNALFRNDGGIFVDVSPSGLPGVDTWSISAAAGDFDGDGDDDLFIANYIRTVAFPNHVCAQNTLLENDGTGRFTDRSFAYGIDAAGCSLAVAMSDYDNDGDLDLLSINDFGHFNLPNQLYRNDGPQPDGGWGFTNVSEESGFGVAVYGMGVATADINQDGWLDYFVTSIGSPRFLLGGPDGQFTDATVDYGMDIQFASEGYQVTWSTAFEDLNRDGGLDLFAVGGHIPATKFLKNDAMQDHVMMINTGQLPWSESPNSWSLPIGPDSNGRSLSIADYNQDGHADLLIGHSQGTISLYKNTSTVPVPLRVRVQPRYTGPSGAGTRVEATSPACASWNQPFEFTAGGALGGSSPQEIRISPPSDCSDPLPTIQLRVQWASGWVEFLSADAGEFVLFKEPEWLVVTGNDITLDAPPNSETVLILSDNVPVGPTTLNNNGQWTATFVDPQPGQQTRLSIMVDGKMLAIHPRQEWPSATKVHIRSFPQHLIEEQTVDFFMTLPELPDDSVAGLLVDGVSIEMQLNKEGNWAGMSPKLVPPTVTLQALVDGVPFGEPITQDVHPPFDLIFSRLRYEQLWYLEADLPLMTMSVVTELRDRNGALLDPNTTLVELIMNNKLQTPSVVLKQSEETIQGYPCKDFPDGASLEVRVNGQPWGPPQVFHHLASPPEIVAFVDPAHSRCSTAMSSMRADGQDIATVLLYLRDSHNNPIPHFGELPVPILDGVTLVPGSVHAGEQRYEFQIRAATQPGQAKISAALHTIPLGFNCYIDLWPAKPKTPLAVQSSHITAAPETLPINAPDPSEIGILPRQENGRLIGSNINLSATTSLGKLGEPVEYVGIGRYRTQLVSGAIAGSAHVAVLQDGVDTGLFTVVDFFDPDVPPEPEPSPDEGNSAEATESEPSPPVEEAVEEAGEDATDIRVDSMETDTAVTDTEPTPDVAVEPDTSPSNDSSNRSDTDTTPTADADTSRSPPDTTSSPDSAGPPKGDSSASLEDTADSGPATGVDAQIPSDDTEPRAEPDVSSTAPPKIASGGCSQGTRQPALPALCLLLALTLLLTRAQICEDSPGRTSACHTPPKEASTSTYRSKSSTN